MTNNPFSVHRAEYMRNLRKYYVPFKDFSASVDKNGIPYKRGGLIFFNYDGDVLLDHVGIVVSVGKNSLTYIDGNGGNGLEVARRTVKYSENKIGAYMEF